MLHLSVKTDRAELLRKYSYQQNHADSTSVWYALNHFTSRLQKDGFFTAKADRIRWSSDTLIAEVKTGRQFHWARLHAGNLSAVMQEQSGFREKFFLHQPFQDHEIAVLFDKVLRYAENRGYPFASVQLKQISITDSLVEARIHYQPGPLITFGRLQVNDTAPVKAAFLQAYLDIRPGKAYDERKVRRIPELLRTLPFLVLTKPVEVTFQNESADVILTLSEQKSSQLDGVLNIMPSGKSGNGLLLTGELNIGLNNLGKSGKMFGLHWQRLQENSQRLEISYEYPRVFHSPIDAGMYFHLSREDTLYINRQLSAEIAFPFGSNHRLYTLVGWQSSRVLEGGTADVYAMENKLGSFNLGSIGLGYSRQKLDHLLYPRKGYLLSAEGSTGSKKVFYTYNPHEPAPPESASLTGWQQSVKGCWSYYKNSRHWLFFQKFSAAKLFGTSLFANDMFRLGGLHSLRGFYDHFFFASQYVMSNTEFRLMFEQTAETYSYLFVFYDQAYLSESRKGQTVESYVAGTGAGVSLTTSAGLFSLVYGVGKPEKQLFLPVHSKIHFGYISRF